MLAIRNNLREYEDIFYETNPNFDGITKLTVPFIFD